MKYPRRMLCVFFLLLTMGSNAQEDTDFFKFWQSYTDIENSLFKHFSSVAYDQLEIRKAEVAGLKTEEDWLQRQTLIRSKLKEILGPFPEKTPLNPKITEVLKKDGYRIEKTIYESVPGNFVTGALYVPNGVKRNAPAIFYACGHTLDGFRASVYQRIIVNLVKKGFVVFTIDPMGQGERYEYWDEQKNEPKFPNPDHAHSYAGAQCLISGYSTASYFIWDVMRGIDYLLSRKEVDSKRLGMTGRSGGGNLTAYLGALDDRILATAPECYITSYKYLYKTRGPQCAEQNLYQMIEKGLDHVDFIEARAPKPSLIVSTTRDFFSIQGTREAFKEAKKMYTSLGVPENLTMVEDDDKHTSTKKNREAMYAFFQKELNNPGSPEDLDVVVPSAKELQVTNTGQLVIALKGKTVYLLNKGKVEKQIELLIESRANDKNHLKNTISNAAKISGFKAPTNYGQPIFAGRFVYPEYTLEKYLVPGSGDYELPSIVLRPSHNSNNKMILFFDSKGMQHAIDQDDVVHKLLAEGYSLLLTDLPGIGSLGPGYLKGDSYINNVSYNQWFGAMLTGKSFVGLRSEDMLRITFFAKNNLNENHISAISSGPLASGLLHAAAFEKNIKTVGLLSPFLSYTNIATTKMYDSAYISFTVPGAIQKYDLPDLMALLCPRKLFIINPKSGEGLSFDKSSAQESLKFPLAIYEDKNVSKNIAIFNTIQDKEEVIQKIISSL